MIIRLLLIVLASAAAALPVHSIAASTQQLSLKSLHTGERIPAVPNNQLATVAMIYQPDCSWCKKQEQYLSQINRQCNSKINLLLIGNNGSVRELKRELKYFDKKIPAFHASRQFLHHIGGVAASPTTVFFDKDGNVLAKKRGYIPPAQLFNAVKVISNQGCAI